MGDVWAPKNLPVAVSQASGYADSKGKVMSLTACVSRTILMCTLGMSGCGFDPFIDGLSAGNSEGHCAVPEEAQAEDASHPDRVIGNGSPENCTGEDVIQAIAAGGVITFNCGPKPIVILLDRTAHVGGRSGSRVVIDILYFDGTDQSVGWPLRDEWTTIWPTLSVQNITLLDGNAELVSPGCGAALYLTAGQLKVVNSRFFRNHCNDDHWDGGGGAIHIEWASPPRPVYVVGSTFGGSPRSGNIGSNGGAIKIKSAVDVMVLNSVFSHNAAQPYIESAGGALDIACDRLSLCGVKLTDNHAEQYGGALDFFGKAGRGLLSITDSTICNNSNEVETPGYPGIRFFGQIEVLNSLID